MQLTLDRQLDWRRVWTIAALAFVVAYYVAMLQHGTANDARIIHGAWSGSLYDGDWHTGAFIYSPAFAQVIYPLTLLPVELFYALLTAVSIGVVVWCAGPIVGSVLLLTPPVIMDLQMGNFNVAIGAAIVLGFRHPTAWAFVLLTKVTPGIGLLWFVCRREWRSLGIALGVTVAVVGISALVTPDLWVAWVKRLMADAGLGPNPTALVLLDAPLILRMALAAGLVAIAAWRGWHWLVVVAGFLAQPAVTAQRAAMLVGGLALLTRGAWASRP